MFGVLHRTLATVINLMQTLFLSVPARYPSITYAVRRAEGLHQLQTLHKVYNTKDYMFAYWNLVDASAGSHVLGQLSVCRAMHLVCVVCAYKTTHQWQ